MKINPDFSMYEKNVGILIDVKLSGPRTIFKGRGIPSSIWITKDIDGGSFYLTDQDNNRLPFGEWVTDYYGKILFPPYLLTNGLRVVTKKAKGLQFIVRYYTKNTNPTGKEVIK